MLFETDVMFMTVSDVTTCSTRTESPAWDVCSFPEHFEKSIGLTNSSHGNSEIKNSEMLENT
jgi:hypothetical protein